MRQAAPRELSNDRQNMGLQYRNQVRCQLCYARRSRGKLSHRLTVSGPFELHVQFADVIVYKLDLPIAHHPAIQGWESAGAIGKYQFVTEHCLQFHHVHLPPLARRRHLVADTHRSEEETQGVQDTLDPRLPRR